MPDSSAFITILSRLDTLFGSTKGFPSLSPGTTMEYYALRGAYNQGVAEVISTVHSLFEEMAGRDLEVPREPEKTEDLPERQSADQYLLIDVQQT